MRHWSQGCKLQPYAMLKSTNYISESIFDHFRIYLINERTVILRGYEFCYQCYKTLARLEGKLNYST